MDDGRRVALTAPWALEYRAGDSFEQIADRYERSPTVVRVALYRAEVPLRDPADDPPPHWLRGRRASTPRPLDRRGSGDEQVTPRRRGSPPAARTLDSLQPGELLPVGPAKGRGSTKGFMPSGKAPVFVDGVQVPTEAAALHASRSAPLVHAPERLLRALESAMRTFDWYDRMMRRGPTGMVPTGNRHRVERDHETGTLDVHDVRASELWAGLEDDGQRPTSPCRSSTDGGRTWHVFHPSAPTERGETTGATPWDVSMDMRKSGLLPRYHGSARKRRGGR